MSHGWVASAPPQLEVATKRPAFLITRDSRRTPAVTLSCLLHWDALLVYVASVHSRSSRPLSKRHHGARSRASESIAYILSGVAHGRPQSDASHSSRSA